MTRGYLVNQLLKDKEIESFVRLFLERNFYRNLKARTRSKPNEQLWRIWFGYNVVFGLLIAPKYENNFWNIDKSEIRRAEYEYWTIGHIIEEGLIDNDSNMPFKIDSMEKFELIYLSIFKKLSNSNYEKIFYNKYIEYLKKSDNPKEEPFLIPEVRYGGLEHKHKYRLDFTILNPHTHEYIGFEISPSSSHMNVSGAKTKNQKDINEELSGKWDKEIGKTIYNPETTFNQSTITFCDIWDNDAEIGEIEYEKVNRLTNEPENCYHYEHSQYVLMDKAVKLIVNCICYLNSSEKDIKISATNEQAEILLNELRKTKKTQQKNKLKQKLEKQTYSKIHFLGSSLKKYFNEQKSENELEPHWRRGHWRNQPFGTNLSESKLIWIKPTIVRKDKGEPKKGHIYEI